MRNSNNESYTPGKCFECKNGEHEDYSDKGSIFKIYGENGKYIKKGYLCEDHQDQYLTDGYDLKED